MLNISLDLIPDVLLGPHFPSKKISTPMVVESFTNNVPSLQPPTTLDPAYDGDFEDYSAEVHEWLALILLESPRISKDDDIDPLLSRYVVTGDSVASSSLTKVTWQGFLSPMWAHKAFVQILLAIPQDGWFSYVLSGFSNGWFNECKTSTILKIPGSSCEYMLWEIA